MPSEVERKLAAILSADVVGYSRPPPAYDGAGPPSGADGPS